MGTLLLGFPETRWERSLSVTTLIDVLLGLSFVLTSLAGLRNGFFRELFSLVGLALGVIGAIRFTGPSVAQIDLGFFHSELGATTVFVGIFLLVFVVTSIAGALLATLWEGKSPGLPSRGVGLLLGAFRGYLLVVVLGGAIVLLADEGSSTLARSRVLPWLGPGIAGGAALLPDDLDARLEQRWKAIPFQPSWRGKGIAI